MMKIESISEKADGAGRYRLQLSNGSVLRLYPETVSEFNLYSDRELTEEELRRIREMAGAVSAKMRAVRIISASSVSARDLERRLCRKGERQEDAKAAVQWMQDLSFVDDRNTARQIVRRGLSKGYGKNRLRQMLYEKQIPKELWDEVLEDLPDPDEDITAFLDQRLGEDPDSKEIKRAVDALIRRGHTWQDIRRCLMRRGQPLDNEPEE